MIAMGRVGGPGRIRVVWRDYLYQARRFGDAMQFANESHHIRRMLDDMPADNLVKLVVGEWIGNRTEIVNYVGL